MGAHQTKQQQVDATTIRQEVNNSMFNAGNITILIIIIIIIFALHKVDKYFKKYVRKHSNTITNV